MYFLIYGQPKCNTEIFYVGVLTAILNSFIIPRVYATCLIHLFHFDLIIQKILCYVLLVA